MTIAVFALLAKYQPKDDINKKYKYSSFPPPPLIRIDQMISVCRLSNIKKRKRIVLGKLQQQKAGTNRVSWNLSAIIKVVTYFEIIPGNIKGISTPSQILEQNHK